MGIAASELHTSRPCFPAMESYGIDDDDNDSDKDDGNDGDDEC